MSKRRSTLLKIAITVLGLAYVVWKVPLATVGRALLEANWWWVLVALILVTISLVLRAYRWQLLLDGLGVTVGFGRLVELYFVGNFFNAFLPSGFGGDAVRILEVARNVPAAVATGTVIVDRLTGLLMLFAMSLLAMPFRSASFPDELALVVSVISLVGLVGGLILLDGRLIRRFGRWLPGPLSPVDNGPVAKVLQAVQGCGWPAVLRALGVSVVFNLMLVVWWMAAGKALGLTIPFTHYLLVVPILSVAMLVPSISGLGVRESLAPVLFTGGNLTVSAGQAVALSLLVFAVLRLSSISSAFVYLYTIMRDGRNRREKVSGTPSEQTRD
jgi:glycosyltransferase 2 family protein